MCRCDYQQDLACTQTRLICKHQILLIVIMSTPHKVAQNFALHANTSNLQAPDISHCHHVHSTLQTSACKVAKNFALHANTSYLQAPDTLLTGSLFTPQLNTSRFAPPECTKYVFSYLAYQRLSRRSDILGWVTNQHDKASCMPNQPNPVQPPAQPSPAQPSPAPSPAAQPSPGQPSPKLQPNPAQHPTPNPAFGTNLLAPKPPPPARP